MLTSTTFSATKNPRGFSPARSISGTKMLNLSCFENPFFSPEQSLRALIIEDEFFITMVMEDALRPLGYTRFDVADCVAEAIQAAEENCPDLIVADERLADGRGTDAVRAICSGRKIPVVFVTGSADEVAAVLPDAIIVQKPFHEGNVHAAVYEARKKPLGSEHRR
jgi:CheY-like chemotaxis protein